MTNAEAIKTLRLAQAEVEWEYPMDIAAAIDVAVKALENLIPKKPKYYGDSFAQDGTLLLSEWRCPRCEARFTVFNYNHCPNCGQAIDWEDAE